MGDVKIQDSGYIKPTNSGTQASSANRANSGSSITIKQAEFIPIIKRNISSQPELSINTTSEVNLGSLENMQFTLRCILNMKNDTDMALVAKLLDLVRTNGYKYMWYDYTNSTTERNNGMLIYEIALNSLFGHTFTNGEKTAFSVSDNFYHLHVLFTDIQVRDTAVAGIINYELKGIVLPVSTSTI